jgi:hypothetical protein
MWPGGIAGYLKRESERWLLDDAILYPAINRYRYTGRAPESLKDLCESGATALRCEDWINPFTGIPYPEGREGIPGAVFLERSVADNGKPVIQIKESTLDPQTSVLVTKTRLSEGERTAGPRKTPTVVLSKPVLAAYSVSFAVETMIRCVADAGSWELATRRLPILKKLRNEFTGGYARAVFEATLPTMSRSRFLQELDTGPPFSERELAMLKQEADLIQSQAPSAGNFLIIWRPGDDQDPKVKVFGESRGVVSEILTAQARARGSRIVYPDF